MDIKILGETIVKKAKKWGADEAEACLENIKNFEVTVRRGEVETLQKSVSRGLGLRVFVRKQLGFSYTSDLTERAIDDAIRKTIALARITEAKPWQGLPDFGPQPLPDLDLHDPKIADVADERKIAIAREVEKIALGLDPRISNTNGGDFSDSEQELGIFNSRGVSCLSRSTQCSFGTSIVVGEGNNMQSGSWGSSKRFFVDLAPVEEVARTAVGRALEKLGPKPVPTKVVPVIFDRYAGRTFWMGILYALNGDAAFRKTTFMCDKLGQAITVPSITIADNPTIPRFLASVPFDGEGKATGRNLIIDAGVLKMFFYDAQIARKAKVKTGTITQRRGYQSMPYAGFLNIIVAPGKETFASLFKDVKEGFYVKGLRGLGTDSTTGSFSVGASGFWIVDGVPAFPVDGLTLGGTTLDILKKIDMVADDLDMRSSVNSPSFRIAEMTVGGQKG
jgi:PmbA protein